MKQKINLKNYQKVSKLLSFFEYKLLKGGFYLLPNVPPKLFSLSAIVVGYILIDDMTANEQNAVGNWLMLVAQVLSTNAFYKAVMQERGLDETGKNNSYTFNNDDRESTINMLEKMMSAINTEINNIKKGL